MIAIALAAGVVVALLIAAMLFAFCFIQSRWRRAALATRAFPDERAIPLGYVSETADLLPEHTANRLTDSREIKRPHTEVDATKVADAALLDSPGTSDSEDDQENYAICQMSELLTMSPEPKKLTVGELDVDDVESKTAKITLKNVDGENRFIGYCIVGFGGPAFVVGVRTPSGDRFKKVGVLSPGDIAEETLVVHARCQTKKKPSFLLMAVTCESPKLKNKKKKPSSGKNHKATAVARFSALVKPHIKLDPDEIELVSKIGEGAFGMVYFAKWRKKTEVAVKQLKTISGSAAEWEDLKKEAKLQADLRNPYIATLFGIIVDEPAMVTEYFPRGSLQRLLDHALADRVRKPVDIVSFPLRLRFALDVARGMAFIITLDLLHRDLKPGNVLVAELDPRCQSPCCKITDFGTARMIADQAATNKATKGVGTPVFMAPEILKPPESNPVYSEQSELYSYAILLYMLFSAEEPFPESKFACSWKIANFVTEGHRPELGPLDQIVPARWLEDVSSLVRRSWAQEPENRGTFDAAADALDGMLKQVLQDEDGSK
jgi:hypothetical protein